MKRIITFLFCFLTLSSINCLAQESHFWTTDPNGELLPKDSYRREGVAFYMDNSASGIPIYRFFAPGRPHFWTSDSKGELLPKPPFQIENNANAVFMSVQTGVPVYRWVNGSNHFWTTDFNGEKLDKIIRNGHGWQREGIAFFAKYGAAEPNPINAIPVYRWVYDPNSISKPSPLPEPPNPGPIPPVLQPCDYVKIERNIPIPNSACNTWDNFINTHPNKTLDIFYKKGNQIYNVIIAPGKSKLQGCTNYGIEIKSCNFL